MIQSVTVTKSNSRIALLETKCPLSLSLFNIEYFSRSRLSSESVAHITHSNSLMMWDKRGEDMGRTWGGHGENSICVVSIINTDHVDMLSDEISPPAPGHRLSSSLPPHYTHPGNLQLKPNFPRTVNLFGGPVPLLTNPDYGKFVWN